MTRLRKVVAEQIRVMGICGTYGADSANGRMLEIAFEHCEKLGAECIMWDNSQTPLPLVGAEGSWDDENVKAFQEMATTVSYTHLTLPTKRIV